MNVLPDQPNDSSDLKNMCICWTKCSMVQIPKFTYSIFVLKFSLVIQFYNQKKMIFLLVRFKLYAMIDTCTCTENL